MNKTHKKVLKGLQLLRRSIKSGTPPDDCIWLAEVMIDMLQREMQHAKKDKAIEDPQRECSDNTVFYKDKHGNTRIKVGQWPSGKPI